MASSANFVLKNKKTTNLQKKGLIKRNVESFGFGRVRFVWLIVQKFGLMLLKNCSLQKTHLYCSKNDRLGTFCVVNYENF